MLSVLFYTSEQNCPIQKCTDLSPVSDTYNDQKRRTVYLEKK